MVNNTKRSFNFSCFGVFSGVFNVVLQNVSSSLIIYGQQPILTVKPVFFRGILKAARLLQGVLRQRVLKLYRQMI